jgi:hypothetical protein
MLFLKISCIIAFLAIGGDALPNLGEPSSVLRYL